MASDVARPHGSNLRSRFTRHLDWLSFASVVIAATLVRLPGIAARGRFDADQGTDMLVLLRMTRDGVLPLLGAKTSVGDFHQAALYYYALWPAAVVSDGDPTVVTLWIAFLGIAAVALAWWLGRAMAGPNAVGRGSIAGFAAGILVAVSPAAIEVSTFIWNPNLIPVFALIALSAAWHAHRSRRARWWILAIAAGGAIPGLHVIGVAFLVGIGVLWLVELGQSPAAERRGLLIAAGAGFVVIGLMFLPLLVHELQTGFAESRLVLGYLAGGSLAGGPGVLERLPFTLLRIISAPFVGLVTDVPAIAAGVTATMFVLVTARLVLSRGPERTGLAWLVWLLAFGTAALVIGAPSLQHVVPGLPNDHYHAFLDPLLAVAAGVAIAGVALGSMPSAVLSPAVSPARFSLAAVILVGLVLVSVARWPPSLDPEGGWPAMRAAGERVLENAGRAPVHFMSLPGFKQPDAVAYPFVRAGGQVASGRIQSGELLVVACDRLFAPVIAAPCGGAAEDALVEARAAEEGTPPPVLVDRFDASPRTSISIYAPVAAR